MAAVSALDVTGPDQDAHAVRWVLVHLSPFARDCADRAIDDDKRWIRRGNATPRKAMALLLERLGLAAHQVTLRPQRMGDLAVIPAEGPHANFPHAFIVDGITASEAEAALAELAMGQRAVRSAA